MVYNSNVWEQWCTKIEEKDSPKTYDHFDHRSNFVERKDAIHAIVSDPIRMEEHAFLPLLKLIISTPRFRYVEKEGRKVLENKDRPISYASHLDTYLYSFYSFALGQHYEQYIKTYGIDACVLAYRSDLAGHCNVQFAREIFDHIRVKGPCVAIALDIKGYFDNIDHQMLKEKWMQVLGINELPPDQYKLYRSLTRYAYLKKNSFLSHFGINLRKDPKKPSLLDYIEGDSFNAKFEKIRESKLIARHTKHELLPDGRKRFFGIPQGLAISALLSNIYLIDYDRRMQELATKEGFLYRRYCDDILIVCDKENYTHLEWLAKKEITRHYLTMQDKKMEIIEFRYDSKGRFRAFDRKKMRNEKPVALTKDNEQRYYKSLQYLGFEFTGLDILIRSGSLSRFYRKMKARINKTVTMAYSKNAKGTKVFKQQLLHRYTHLGKQNFYGYARRACKDQYINSLRRVKQGMDSPAIRRQLRRHYKVLEYTLQNKNWLRARHKINMGMVKKVKSA